MLVDISKVTKLPALIARVTRDTACSPVNPSTKPACGQLGCVFLLRRNQCFPALQAIPASVRRRVEDAVESLAARVTAGDVAARAGIRVSEAETALNALAADTLGTLQVRSCVRHSGPAHKAPAAHTPGGLQVSPLSCVENLLGTCQVEVDAQAAEPGLPTSCFSHSSRFGGRRDLLLTFILHILTSGVICCQVSQQGDVLYVLPANFRAILRSRSWLLRLEPALAAARSAGAYLVRVSFGTALIASVLLVALSVVALLTAASSSDRDNRRCVIFD